MDIIVGILTIGFHTVIVWKNHQWTRRNIDWSDTTVAFAKHLVKEREKI